MCAINYKNKIPAQSRMRMLPDKTWDIGRSCTFNGGAINPNHLPGPSTRNPPQLTHSDAKPQHAPVGPSHTFRLSSPGVCQSVSQVAPWSRRGVEHHHHHHRIDHHIHELKQAGNELRRKKTKERDTLRCEQTNRHAGLPLVAYRDRFSSTS